MQMQQTATSTHKNEDAPVSLEQREDLFTLPDLMRQPRYRRVLLPFLQHKKNERQRRRTRRTSLPAEPATEGVSMSTCMHSLYSYVFGNKNLSDMLYDTVDEVAYLTDSESALVYLYDSDLGKLILAPRHVKSVRCIVTQPIRKYLNLASYIAMEKNYIIIDDVLKEFRIPEGFGQYGYSEEGTLIKSVLGVPMLTTNDEVIGVVEFCRNFRQPPYRESEAEIAVSSIGYVGGAIDQHAKLIQYRRHIALQNYLSDLTRNCCFEEIDPSELLPKIVGHTKKAIEAEYASYLVIDNDYDEPVGDHVAESGFGGLEDGYSTTTKVKLDPNSSLIGKVVDSGETINIHDTETDKLIHMKLDLDNGSVRRAILCMPISLEGKIYGAIELINKKNTLAFNKADESLLSTCCKYCTIGLLFRGQKRDGKRWTNIVLNLEEMITYYMTNNPFDYEPVIPSIVSRAQADDLLSFKWVPRDDGKRTLSSILHMLSELIEDCSKNAVVWSSWLTRVKKCYRCEMAYHNFTQATISCNTMYNLLSRNKELFTPLEVTGLMISSLCNNVDHEGLENTYYQMNQHSLAQIYEQFSLENHHYSTTIFLLKSVELLPRLSEEYGADLQQEIYHCILSTNLERSFSFKEDLDLLLESDSFSWDDEEHRALVKSLMMFYSAVSAQCKKTKLTYSSTKALYEEIYNQGSLESSLGYSTLPNADREMKEYMADYQLEFLRSLIADEAVAQDIFKTLESTIIVSEQQMAPEFKNHESDQSKRKTEKNKRQRVLKEKGLRKYLCLGVNEVSRAVEKGHVLSVLLEKDVDPQFMVSHIGTLCAVHNIPCITISGLRNGTRKAFGIPCICLGVKVALDNEGNPFAAMNQCVSEAFHALSFSKSPTELKSESSVSAETAQLSEVLENVEAAAKPDSVNKSVPSDRPFTTFYRYRTSTKERVFIPKGHKQATDEFISLGSAEDDVTTLQDLTGISVNFSSLETINLKRQRKLETHSQTNDFDVEYRSHEIKRVRPNPNKKKKLKVKKIKTVK